MEFGLNKKLRILIISSGNPTDNSPKMALDMQAALKASNHKVDLLLKYPLKNQTADILSVYAESDIFKNRLYEGIARRFQSVKRKLKLKSSLAPLPNYFFFNTNEEKPPVKSSAILKPIKNEYDLVLVFFWQGMLSAKSIFDIYNKLKAPIFLTAADMYPMTGGCSYFWTCDNLKNGCGRCPGIMSENENDFTRKNFLYKKSVYSQIDCVFLGNSWMNLHAKKSQLFNKIDNFFPVINEHIFKPYQKDILKQQYNLSNQTVLFVGSVSVSEERKGFKYLVEAMHLVAKKANNYIGNTVLVVAGHTTENLQQYFDFEVITIGHLSFEVLAKYYALADIYLSPSIQDAGPMMVNQALLCGTPVVAFDIGTACDVVTEETGYLAKYRDADNYADGLIKLLSENEGQRKARSERCREMGLATSSYAAFAHKIEDIYKKNIVTDAKLDL